MIAGGTGKTPVVGWIARNLSEKYHVAILSRGYGRHTKDFQLLDKHSTPETVGDEPLELQFLLPHVLIAVDIDRKHGIRTLTSGKFGQIDLILMDDGFQHRKVTPGYSIILDDFNRPMRRERLLPAGLLREPLMGLKRANLIITTKKKISYDGSQLTTDNILLVTGISNSQPLFDEISKTANTCRHLKFSDHHRYTHVEAADIRDQYNALLHESELSADPVAPVLLTTGKDYVKLNRIPELADLPLKRIPFGPPVDPDQKQEILNKINQYVEQAYRNS